MNQVLLACAILGSIASAIPTMYTIHPQSVTTVCSLATYDNGVPDAIFAIPFSNVMAAGTAASNALAQAGAQNPLSLQVFAAYNAALRNFQIPMTNIAGLNNADAADIIAVNAQLVAILHALANTNAPVLNSVAFNSIVYDYKVSINLEHSAINRMLQNAAGVSCDKQNSLNSIGSQLSSAFNGLQSQTWLGIFNSLPVSWTSVPSVTCPQECMTLTFVALPDTTSSNPTTSSSADPTNTSTVESQVTGSRTVGGSIQRCLVRPTSIVPEPISIFATAP